MKTERINARTSKQLKEKITKIADEKGVPVSELIDDYIKGLPSSSGIN